MWQGSGWQLLTADRIVFEGPGVLWGLVLLVSTTGGDVTIYDGLDAGSGRSLGAFEGIADQSNPIFFPRGLHLDRGLFVDVGSNVTGILVLYDVISGGE